MKIINRTHWQTRDLKAILVRVADDELDRVQFKERRRKLHVVIKYSRRGSRHSGCATIGGAWCWLNIPREEVDPHSFAILCAHELAHNRGLDHDRMRGCARYHWQAGWRTDADYPWAWARAMPVRRKEVREKPVVPLLDRRYAHAQSMLARWERKAKACATHLRKWKIKVRRYERRKAAATEP